MDLNATFACKPTILERLRDHVEASAERAGAASRTLEKLRAKPILTIDEMGEIFRAQDWWKEPSPLPSAPSFYRWPTP